MAAAGFFEHGASTVCNVKGLEVVHSQHVLSLGARGDVLTQYIASTLLVLGQ